jgi:hypothetical protein
MKKFALLLALGFAFLSAPLWPTIPARAQDAPWFRSLQVSELAPADAYFGRLRMSILGMRNAIKDVSLRIDGASADDLAMLYRKLSLVEGALLDLKDQYPQDSWLPQLGLSLAETFAKMPFAGAQVRANDDLEWVIAEYPTSDQALYAGSIRRARLAPAPTMDIPIEPLLPGYAAP